MQFGKRDLGESTVSDIIEDINTALEEWNQAILSGKADLQIDFGDNDPGDKLSVVLVHGITMGVLLLYMEDILRMSKMMCTSEFDAIKLAATFSKANQGSRDRMVESADINEVFLAFEIVYTVAFSVRDTLTHYEQLFRSYFEDKN